MPPKKKDSKKSPKSTERSSEESNTIESESTTFAAEATTFEAILDSRLKQQHKELQELFFKYHKITQDELRDIKLSQEFMSNKFDEILSSINTLQEENKQLKNENTQLKHDLLYIDNKLRSVEQEQENLRLYSRRDCLEFHGIPVTNEENTDEIIQRVAELLKVDLLESDISTSHRLPTTKGQPIIIAKFTRRTTRDNLYSARSNLRKFSSTSLGYTHNNKLFINESLTALSKQLFWQVRQFKKEHNFKYCWTKYGKVYLRKDDAHAEVISFTSSSDFEKFKARCDEQNNAHA